MNVKINESQLKYGDVVKYKDELCMVCKYGGLAHETLVLSLSTFFILMSFESLKDLQERCDIVCKNECLEIILNR